MRCLPTGAQNSGDGLDASTTTRQVRGEGLRLRVIISLALLILGTLLFAITSNESFNIALNWVLDWCHVIALVAIAAFVALMCWAGHNTIGVLTGDE